MLLGELDTDAEPGSGGDVDLNSRAVGAGNSMRNGKTNARAAGSMLIGR